MKKILFIIDKIELKYFEFNKLVTNFWLIKTFLEKNCEVFISTIPQLSLRQDTAYANSFKAFINNDNIFYDKKSLDMEINSFDLVMFRPDPPVDIDYINATYVFDFVSTKVVNSPKSIRNFNEKLHTLFFKEYMTDVVTTASISDIESFLSKYKQIVLKPLNRCFGSGVFYLQENDPNTRTIINTVTNNGTTLVMCQEFIPAVRQGDIRVLTLGDKVLPYCVKKLPGKDDFKFNNHSDSFLVQATLTDADLKLFEPIAQKLNSLGIVMAGLDVIDNKVIEVNVTSPCYFIKEINAIYGCNLEDEITNYLLTPALLSV